MATDWANVVLCKPADVYAEFHHTEAATKFRMPDTQTEDALVLARIDGVKNRTRQKLYGYIRSHWGEYFGSAVCSTNTVESALNRIDNPSELTGYAVASVIVALLIYGQTVETMRVDIETFESRVKFWQAEADRRWADALPLLKIAPSATCETTVSGPVDHTFSRG